MSEDRIDFSSLDPSCDEERWGRLLRSVTARALAARHQRNSLSVQLVAVALPALGLAASIALVSALHGLMVSRRAETAPQKEPAAYVLARWAEQEEQPATTTILTLLEGEDGTD